MHLSGRIVFKSRKIKLPTRTERTLEDGVLPARDAGNLVSLHDEVFLRRTPDTADRKVSLQIENQVNLVVGPS